MIRRDWFKRQVEILAQALGVVLGLKQKGDIQASVAAIETAIQQAFGLSGKLALGLPLEELLAFACRGVKPSSELLSGLAKLFGEWAELLDAQGSADQAALARERAQALIERAAAAGMSARSKSGP